MKYSAKNSPTMDEILGSEPIPRPAMGRLIRAKTPEIE
ncbi:hypothetical protein Mcup_1553 [Metallosphaera cuprina Ar-4]|uniref:Uncharacterized protein n=1 Tax=Metallosphaera cuprina (strain Ar-4) TaxID=1006006 RepID=F4FZG6_METCR|nr:hypothetical protein Mcup_1553 [Metallosphaera cuprina Ar-4]